MLVLIFVFVFESEISCLYYFCSCLQTMTTATLELNSTKNMWNLRLNFLSFFAKKVVIEKTRVHDFGCWVERASEWRFFWINPTSLSLKLTPKWWILDFHIPPSQLSLSPVLLSPSPSAFSSLYLFSSRILIPPITRYSPTPYILFSFCDFSRGTRTFLFLFFKLWFICSLG